MPVEAGAFQLFPCQALARRISRFLAMTPDQQYDVPSGSPFVAASGLPTPKSTLPQPVTQFRDERFVHV